MLKSLKNNLYKFIFLFIIFSILYIDPLYSDESAKIELIDRLEHHIGWVDSIEYNEDKYISLRKVSRLLNIKEIWYPVSKKIIFKYKNNKIIVIIDSNKMLFNDEIIDIEYPVVLKSGKPYISIKTFGKYFINIVSGKLLYDIEQNKLIVDYKRETIYKIETIDYSDRQKILVYSKNKFVYRDFFSDDVLELEIEEQDINVELNQFKEDDYKLYLKSYQKENAVQIRIGLKRNIKFKIYELDNPNSLVIELMKEKQSEEKEALLGLKDDVTSDLINKYAIRTIVIDPGHGGKDPGAIGPSGKYEKDIVLKIAKYLRRMIIDKTSIKVVLTRSNDRYVSLDRRASIANSRKGDIFISIHCNSVLGKRRSKVFGAETYFISETMDAEAARIAAFENKVLEFENKKISDDNNVLNNILFDLTYRTYVQQSQNLAKKVQFNFRDNLKTTDRGVRQALFYVLRGVKMPSILVETGFISNPIEEKKLNTSAYQKKIAKNIFDGIINFKHEYETRMGLSED